MSAQQATQRAKLLLEVHIKHQSQRFGEYFLGFQGAMWKPIGRFGSFRPGWQSFEKFCQFVTRTKLGANVSAVGHMCVCLAIAFFREGFSVFHDQRMLVASKLMQEL